LILPSPVNPGDTIGVIAPASPFDVERYREGIEVLKKEGFNIKEGENIFQKNDYLAGDVRQRLIDLETLYEDESVKAIMAIRGGYGSMHLLPYLREEDFKKNPRLFIGSSDLTALHLFFNFRVGIVTLYGPMVDGDFGVAEDETNMRVLKKIMALPDEYEYPVGDLLIAHHGRGEGILVGGCLSLIVSLIGTPFEPDFDEKIVFLEDVNEPLYRWDRMLTQLVLSGKLNKARGLIITMAGYNSYEANDFISKFFKGWNIPIVTNFPAGHTVPFFTLPFGYMAEIDTLNRVFRVWKTT